MAKKKKSTSKKEDKKKKKIPKGPSIPKWMYGILPLVAFLLYINTLNHGYVLDDDLVCNKNKYVQADGISGLKDVFSTSFHQGFTGTPDRHYRPMMMAAFTVEKAFFGNKSSTYHFFNVFWFAVGCGLLFLLLKEIFRDKSIWLPLGIGLLFVTHPIHTEVVANIKSRDEIFVFLGLVGSLFSLLKYDQTENKAWLIGSLIFYFIASLAKETGLQIIGLVPLTLYFFSKKKHDIKSIGTTTLFYLIPVVIYFLLRAKFTGDNGQVLGIIDNSLYGASSFGEQLATAISMTGKYLLLLLFPHPLSFDYSAYQIPLVGFTDWRVLLSILVWGGILVLGFKGLKEKSAISYGIIFFLMMFALVCNIFFVTGVTMAERLIFSASLGFSIATGYAIFKYFFKEQTPTTYFAIIGILSVLYSFKTITRNAVWASNETLFETGIITAPNSSRTQSFYGKSLYDKSLTLTDPNQKKQMIEEAMSYFDKSLEIHPGFTDVHHHKGVALDQLERYDEALVSYDNAIATKSDYHLSICNKGLVHYKKGEYKKAVDFITQAHEIAPNNQTIKNNLEVVLLKYRDILRAQGDIDTAIFYDKQVKKLRGELVN